MSNVMSIVGQEMKTVLLLGAFGIAVGALVIGIYNTLRNTNVWTIPALTNTTSLTSGYCNKTVATY